MNARQQEDFARFKAGLNGDHPDEEIPAAGIPFPVDDLPPAWARYVQEGADALPVAPEMIALPMLVEAGSLIGNRAMLVLKRGWEEMATLYGVVIAPSGTMKTPAFKHARWPLRQLQKQERINHDARMMLWAEDHGRWEQEKKMLRGPEPIKPVMRDYFTTDATMEAMAPLLKTTPGIVYESDEISAWVERMNQYRKGGDRPQWLSIHSGEPIKVNRKSADTIFIERPVVGVFGGIQPEIVGSLAGELGDKDGLVYRYLPTIPPVTPKRWNTNEISTEAYAGMVAMFRGIDGLPLMGDGEPIAVRLTPEAEGVFASWADTNSAEAVRLGGALRGFYVKLEAHVARFILILHVADNPGRLVDPVPPETVHRAIRVGEFFRQEIHRLVPLLLLGSGQGSATIGLWSRIRKYLMQLSNCQSVEPSIGENTQNDGGWVSQRDLQRALGTIKTEELTNYLDTYIDLGEVDRRETPIHNGTRVEYRLSGNRQFDSSTVRQFNGRIPEEDIPWN